MINATLFKDALFKDNLVAKDATIHCQVGNDWVDVPYKGFRVTVYRRQRTIEVISAAPDWAEVPCKQPEGCARKVSFAFKHNTSNAYLFVRASYSDNFNARRRNAVSKSNADVFYVEDGSDLPARWLTDADTLDAKKAEAKAKRAADKLQQAEWNDRWVSQCGVRANMVVPDLSKVKAGLWLNLIAPVQANTSLYDFNAMLARKSRSAQHVDTLARHGLDVKDMTEARSQVFVNSTIEAVEAVARAANLNVNRDGLNITISNKHTSEVVRVSPGRFVGNKTYIKVGV